MSNQEHKHDPTGPTCPVCLNLGLPEEGRLMDPDAAYVSAPKFMIPDLTKVVCPLCGGATQVADEQDIPDMWSWDEQWKLLRGYRRYWMECHSGHPACDVIAFVVDICPPVITS